MNKRPIMPDWLREALEDQTRRIAWYRVRANRTGTGWPETPKDNNGTS